MCVWRQSHGQSNIRGGVNTQSPSTIHPTASAAHLISGSASGPSVVAHTHQQRTQQSREQGEGSASSAVAARSDGVGGGAAWTTAACCAARTEAHSTKQCDVGPCSQCATGTSRKEERKRPWKRVRVQGLVAWCLRWITVGQCLAAAHKWGRSCIEGVPPKGQRGLLALCCCCGGCLKPDGGGGAE